MLRCIVSTNVGPAQEGIFKIYIAKGEMGEIVAAGMLANEFEHLRKSAESALIAGAYVLDYAPTPSVLGVHPQT
jgi:hypothetical protein